MSDDAKPAGPSRPPMNVYTAMLALAFIALVIACGVLAIEFFSSGLPPRPQR